MLDLVREAGMALEGVTFDGVLRVGGRFMAGMAKHHSAEPDSLVLRVGEAEREAMLAERPGVYYVTDYYAPHGVVLVRLGMASEGELRDLLRASWRITRVMGTTRRPLGSGWQARVSTPRGWGAL